MCVYARTHTWLENKNLKIEAKSVLTLQFVAYKLPSRCQPIIIVIDVNAHTNHCGTGSYCLHVRSVDWQR